LPALRRTARSARRSRAGGTERRVERRTARRRRRLRLRGLIPGRRLRRRGWRILRRAPLAVQLLVALTALGLTWLSANAVYQVVRKPTELFFPVSGTLYKTPAETWRTYGALFRRDSTALIEPELLAALAQVEGSGNPVARTYWRWSWRSRPFELYRPASSAVGMYQITDGTFAEAKRYCIHRHTVMMAGRWDDFGSCWFNGLYFRVLPSDAVELTAAYLDRHVADALARRAVHSTTPAERRSLAALVHLCGAGAGEAYVRRGFRLAPGERCGDHDARAYLARVESMRRTFERLGRDS